MLKIFANRARTSLVFEWLTENFLDYTPPDKFQQVFDIRDADVVFMTATLVQNNFGIHLSSREPTLGNLQELSDLYLGILNKQRVIWVDAKGPSVHRDSDIFDPDKIGLRDEDILVSPGFLPRKLHTFRDVHPVEKSIFRRRGNFERLKGSVAIVGDHIYDGSIETLSQIMDVVSKLYVAGNIGNHVEQMQEVFGGSYAKVFAQRYEWPFGMVRLLSEVEFVLHLHTGVGVEMMGIEGGMCGCQPIYPDIELYRDIFDGTGVAFFDLENPVESLKWILEAGSQFDEKMTEAFRTKFSGEDTLPDFWEEVYELCS